MLIVWKEFLKEQDRQQLVCLDPYVVYWPCSYSRSSGVVVPVEWWINFSSCSSGLLWLLDRSESSSLVYK